MATSSYMNSTTPAAAVAVIGPQFCLPHPVDLLVTSKPLSLTTSYFEITDANRKIVFKVKGKLFSIRGRCSLRDSAGNVLLTMQQKVISMHSRWQVFHGKSTKAKNMLYNIKLSSFFQIKTKLDVCLVGNSKESVPDFTVKGSYSNGSCTIYLGKTKTIIAQMSEHNSAKNFLLGNDVYKVTVYPHVDYAFIVSPIVILYRINKEQEDLASMNN